MPVISATWEAETGESLEPRTWRLRRAEILPLHSSLGNKSETPSQKNKKKRKKESCHFSHSTTDAAHTLALAQDHSMDIPNQDQLKQSAVESSTSRRRTAEDDIPTLPTSQHKCVNSREDEDLIENLTQDETSRMDLGFEEWDVAGLP